MSLLCCLSRESLLAGRDLFASLKQSKYTYSRVISTWLINVSRKEIHSTAPTSKVIGRSPDIPAMGLRYQGLFLKKNHSNCCQNHQSVWKHMHFVQTVQAEFWRRCTKRMKRRHKWSALSVTQNAGTMRNAIYSLAYCIIIGDKYSWNRVIMTINFLLFLFVNARDKLAVYIIEGQNISNSLKVTDWTCFARYLFLFIYF